MDLIKTIPTERAKPPVTETLSRDHEEKLRAFLDRPPVNSSEQSEKEYIYRKTEGYHVLFNNKPSARLYYHSLPQFMAITNISTSQLFEIMGVDIGAIPDYIKHMLWYCSTLKEEKKRVLEQQLKACSFDWIKGKNIELGRRRPSFRTIMFILNTKSRPEARKKLGRIPSIEKYTDTYYYRIKLTFEEIIYAAHVAEVSLHWIFPYIDGIYSREPIVERIIDYYLFLPDIVGFPMRARLQDLFNESHHKTYSGSEN